MKCTVTSTSSGNVFLRLAQYQRAMDMDYRLQLSRSIVHTKIASQLRMIRSQRWEGDFNWQEACQSLEALQSSIPSRMDMDTLRGVEGSASRLYFSCFAQRMTYLPFHGRSRRPAKDEANATLNLGYTLLTNECISLLEAAGLDSGLGLMHGVAYGRSSLALDIIEAFRVDAVDRLVLRLCNWRMLTEQSFDSDSKIGFRLKPEAFRLFLTQYENHLAAPKQDLRAALRTDVAKLRHALLECKGFTPWEGAI